jgi:hypothetical protein
MSELKNGEFQSKTTEGIYFIQVFGIIVLNDLPGLIYMYVIYFKWDIHLGGPGSCVTIKHREQSSALSY